MYSISTFNFVSVIDAVYYVGILIDILIVVVVP